MAASELQSLHNTCRPPYSSSFTCQVHEEATNKPHPSNQSRPWRSVSRITRVPLSVFVAGESHSPKESSPVCSTRYNPTVHPREQIKLARCPEIPSLLHILFFSLNTPVTIPCSLKLQKTPTWAAAIPSPLEGRARPDKLGPSIHRTYAMLCFSRVYTDASIALDLLTEPLAIQSRRPPTSAPQPAHPLPSRTCSMFRRRRLRPRLRLRLRLILPS